MKRYLPAVTVALALMALLLSSCGGAKEADGPRNRAAIVDQLYLLEPDPEFIAEATRILEAYGFTVDLWQGGEITVDFYRKLPERGYGFILFRVHSGTLLTLEGGEVKPLPDTYIFTAENYTTTRYITEQLTDKVSNALMAEDYPLVFAVSSEFIQNDSKGSYDNAVIIAMGCESYRYDDMPLAFIKKGASAYIGWSTVVSLEYVDTAILKLLDNLCTGNMTLSRGIDQTMAELGHDPYFDAYLKCYPAESGDRNITELIQ